MSVSVLGLNKRDLNEKNKKLREQGLIPGVIYGGRENCHVSVSLEEFRKLLERVGRSNLVEIQLEGKKILSLVKDFQRDPLTDEFIHFDLLEVSQDRELRVQIPIEYLGIPKGVKEGGVLEILQDRVEVACKAKDIPSSISVDISHLEIGFSVHLKDIMVPTHARFTQDLSTVLLVIAGETAASAEAGSEETGTPTTES